MCVCSLIPMPHSELTLKRLDMGWDLGTRLFVRKEEGAKAAWSIVGDNWRGCTLFVGCAGRPYMLCVYHSTCADWLVNPKVAGHSLILVTTLFTYNTK